MANVAMFGAGMMGSAMVERWLGQGEKVRVWNRTHSRAQALEKHGATAVADPVATLEGAERVHIILSDDAAVDELLDKIASRVPKGVPVIDHTTVTPAGVRARTERMQKAGVDFIHAPVFMGPSNAREGSGLVLVSGSRAISKRILPVLEKMTGAVWDLGERSDRAAAFKLFGNQLIIFNTAGLTEMYMLAKSVGISAEEAYELFGHFNPGSVLKTRGAKMMQRDWTPTFELRMARKDARLMIETGAAGGEDLAVLKAIAKRMDEFIERGFGEKDAGVTAYDAVSTPAKT